MNENEEKPMKISLTTFVVIAIIVTLIILGVLAVIYKEKISKNVGTIFNKSITTAQVINIDEIQG